MHNMKTAISHWDLYRKHTYWEYIHVFDFSKGLCREDDLGSKLVSSSMSLSTKLVIQEVWNDWVPFWPGWPSKNNCNLWGIFAISSLTWSKDLYWLSSASWMIWAKGPFLPELPSPYNFVWSSWSKTKSSSFGPQDFDCFLYISYIKY